MKRIIVLCCIAVIPFTFLSAYAQENKVVVIPLNSNRGPGDWKTVSVSAFAGMPELDTIQVRAAYLCGHRVYMLFRGQARRNILSFLSSFRMGRQ